LTDLNKCYAIDYFSLDLCMNKTLRNFGIASLAFVAYRGYKLYELANSIDFEFYGLKFQKPANLQQGFNAYQVVIILKIKNPTKTPLSMKGIEGEIIEGTDVITRFKTGNFSIKGGDNFVNIIAELQPKYVATNILPFLIAKQSPIFDIRARVIFPFGFKYATGFKIKVSDYLPKDFNAILFK
jgi:hypothetical protein